MAVTNSRGIALTGFMGNRLRFIRRGEVTQGATNGEEEPNRGLDRESYEHFSALRTNMEDLLSIRMLENYCMRRFIVGLWRPYIECQGVHLKNKESSSQSL